MKYEKLVKAVDFEKLVSPADKLSKELKKQKKKVKETCGEKKIRQFELAIKRRNIYILG